MEIETAIEAIRDGSPPAKFAEAADRLVTAYENCELHNPESRIGDNVLKLTIANNRGGRRVIFFREFGDGTTAAEIEAAINCAPQFSVCGECGYYSQGPMAGGLCETCEQPDYDPKINRSDRQIIGTLCKGPTPPVVVATVCGVRTPLRRIAIRYGDNLFHAMKAYRDAKDSLPRVFAKDPDGCWLQLAGD